MLLALCCARAFGGPDVVLRGTVVNEEGEPIEAATVFVSRDGEPVVEATTDAEGQFEVSLAELGPVDVQVGKAREEETDSSQMSWITLSAEVLGVEPGTKALRLVAVPDALEGQVRVRVGTTEGYLSGATVWAWPVVFPRKARLRPPGNRTNAIGRVELSGLPRIPITIEVGRKAPWCPARGIVAQPDPLGIDLVRIEVERERILTGRVTDESGQPVAGCGVMAAPTGDTVSRAWGDLTGSDGGFRIGVPASWDAATLLVDCEGPTEASAHRLAVEIDTTLEGAAASLTVVLGQVAEARGVEVDDRVTREREASRQVTDAVLSAHYLGPRVRSLVLQRELGVHHLDDDASTFLGEDIHATTLLDLERKAQVARVIPPGLDPGVPIIVLGRVWLSYLHEVHGWGGYRHFNQLFPKSNGLLTLGPVGLSEDGTQAVMHVGWLLWPRIGEGYYYLLAKRDGAWHVVRRAMTWIS